MTSGFDRYFQIVRCFRDEDLRADRQPEFTQVDFEMSFVNKEDIMEFTEGLIKKIFTSALKINLNNDFERITYDDSIRRFGNDRPDMRFGLELEDITDIFKDTEFKVFKDVVKEWCNKVPKSQRCKIIKKDIDDLTIFAQSNGAKGLAWIKVNKEDLQSPIIKFFTENEIALLKKIKTCLMGIYCSLVQDQVMK